MIDDIVYCGQLIVHMLLIRCRITHVPSIYGTSLCKYSSLAPDALVSGLAATFGCFPCWANHRRSPSHASGNVWRETVSTLPTPYQREYFAHISIIRVYIWVYSLVAIYGYSDTISAHTSPICCGDMVQQCNQTNKTMEVQPIGKVLYSASFVSAFGMCYQCLTFVPRSAVTLMM